MQDISWSRYPQVAQAPHARSWVQNQWNLGLAPNTIDAYGRALNDYLDFCQRQDIEPETATREHLSLYVRDLTSRTNPHGANARILNSGVGLANATLQQRLTAVRLWYDYLIEEGIRVDNPVGRGHYTQGKSFGGEHARGELIPRYRKLPWIPDEQQWLPCLRQPRRSHYATG